MAIETRQPLSEVETWDDATLATVLDVLADRAERMNSGR